MRPLIGVVARPLASIEKCEIMAQIAEHSENPTQTPVRQGIARLAVGAALLTIPYFSTWSYNTLSAGTAVAAYTPFPTIGGAGGGGAPAP